MRAFATFLCLFMAAPDVNGNQAREARRAEWTAALEGAANPTGERADDLPQPLQEALRRWSREDGRNGEGGAA